MHFSILFISYFIDQMLIVLFFMMKIHPGNNKSKTLQQCDFSQSK